MGKAIKHRERILVVKNLGKRYEEGKGEREWIFQEVSFTLHRNRIIGVVGPSESGKTTLLRTLTGLEKPDRGSIHFLFNKAPHQDIITMTFEEPALLPWLTIEENIRLALEHLHMDEKMEKARISSALGLVGLAGYEEVFPFELSRSLKVKASLARALAVDPVVLLMDSPFDNLDPLSTIALKEELLRILEEQPTEGIVFSTNSVEDVVSLAHEVVILGGENGEMKGKLAINLPFPRDLKSETFQAYVDEVYEFLLK